MDKVVKKKRLIKKKTIRKIKQVAVEWLICIFWIITIGLTSATGSYFGAYVYNHGIPLEKMTNEDSVEDNQSCRQTSEHSWNCNFNNDENATIGTDTIGIDSDNDSFPTPADNTTLGVKVNDTYPDIKISQKFLSPKELRKAILQVIPERVTVKRLKVTKKEVTISGVLPEHAEMDILLEKLKSISALKRFDTPSLKPNDGGGVTFSLRISLNPEEYVVLPWSYTADIHSENWTCYDCDGGPFAEPHGQPPQEWPDEPRVESGPFRQQN